MVSMAQGGVVHRGVTLTELKAAMCAVQNKTYVSSSKFKLWKRGKKGHEKNSGK